MDYFFGSIFGFLVLCVIIYYTADNLAPFVGSLLERVFEHFGINLKEGAPNKRSSSGVEGLKGSVVTASEDFHRDPETARARGKVSARGEIWDGMLAAVGDDAPSKGDRLTVEDVAGLKLILKKQTKRV